MKVLVDTLEGHLRLALGDRDFQILVLQQQLDAAQDRIADLEARLAGGAPAATPEDAERRNT